MLKYSLKYKGREMSPRDFVRALQKDIADTAVTAVEKEIRRVRCPVHGSTARITRKPGGMKAVSFGVNGCCQELIDSVRARLKR